MIDTGVFNDDRYFDVLVEYAKVAPDDILIKISASNRGKASAPLHVLPTFWFRNTWAWWPDQPKPAAAGCQWLDRGIVGTQPAFRCASAAAVHRERDQQSRLFGTANASPYVKDGINDFVVSGRQDAINPNNAGTKAAGYYHATIDAGATAVFRLRLNAADKTTFNDFDKIMEQRRREASAFYQAITPHGLGEDEANVMRQALAGMLWSKQYFLFDVDKWIDEHEREAAPQS